MPNSPIAKPIRPTTADFDRRIVVADDDPITLRLLAAWLEHGGYEVYPVANGEAALDAIESVRPAMVITDWNMPGLSGLDICRHIRGRDRQPYTYVLIVTAREDRTDVIEAIDAGADDYLIKPIKQESLLARVGQARVALQRFRRYAELAETDPLTGVANRRRFHELCVREIARAARYGGTLSCLLLDIDRFKHINDTYGHATGDEILKAVSDLIGRHTRECDCVCRYGGDEFCILLPQTGEPEAVAFADRLRSQIAQLRVTAGTRSVSAQATVGVAEWRQDVATPRQLIDLADESLLAAKRSGRDRAVGYSSLGNLPDLERTSGHAARCYLAQVRAADVMIAPVVTLAQNEPLLQAAELFARLRIPSLPIVDAEERLVGIITEKDVLSEAYSEANWEQPVSEVMNVSVVSYEETTPLDIIWEFLARVTLRRGVIVADDRPVGVISRGTLLRWLGNWGTIARDRQPSRARSGVGDLCRHIQATASAIVREAERLKNEAHAAADDPIPKAFNAAIRLQEQAQALIALSQVHACFEPRIHPARTAASPLPAEAAHSGPPLVLAVPHTPCAADAPVS